MAAGAVWAIDIGNNSLKALRLTAERGVVEVVGFDNIQHGKILTGAGVKPAEKEELFDDLPEALDNTVKINCPSRLHILDLSVIL